MTRIFSTLTVLVAAVLLTAGPMAGLAVAQETNGTATSTPTGEATEGPLTAEDIITITTEMDPRLTSPEVATRVRAWIDSNPDALTAEQRDRARSWVRTALDGRATSTATATATETRKATNASDARGERVDRSISPAVTLRSWRYANGRFTLTLLSDGPSRIMLTDVGSMLTGAEAGRGVSDVNARGVTLDGGTNTVTFHVETYENEAFVSVADGSSVVQISTGSTAGPLDQLDRVSGGTAFLLGAVVMLTWVLIAAWHTLKREDGGVIVAGEEVAR